MNAKKNADRFDLFPAHAVTAVPDESLSPYDSDASPIGLIITTPAGTIISFNQAIRDMLDVRLEDYVDKNVCDLYANPDARQHLLDQLARMESVHNFEVEVKHHDGSTRTVLANIDRIDYNGEALLLTSLQDITHLKQSFDCSDPDQINYQSLFRNAPVGITVTDQAGHLLVANNAIRELTGYMEDELETISIRDLYLIPEDRKRLLELTHQHGKVRDFETLFKHKIGTAIAVLLNTDLIDFCGQSNILLTSIRDISYLKKAEHDLARERDFSNTLLNIAAILIVVLDHTGTITQFNRSCEQLSGYLLNEVRGKHLWETEFFDPEITRERMDAFLQNNNRGVYETRIRSKSGGHYLVSWTFATMPDWQGHLDYIIATGIDITQQRKASEQLRLANEELAERVNELQTRSNEMNLVNEMGEQLQSCQTVPEACDISAQYIQRICPKSGGALYLIKESRNLAEATGSWGDPPHTKPVFEPMGCWAIRRGRSHLVDQQHPGLLCEHVNGPHSGNYLCVPLMVNGEAIGILHLNHVDPEEPSSATGNPLYTNPRVQLITMVAEHIALALANLKLKETLRQQSIRDALTGLYNRRYMEETMERELSRAAREQKPVGIMMFDIDHFKRFNDLEGHDAGDALLRELGLYLNKCIRGSDIVCRYGGEEFLAVLPGASREQTRERAEEVRLGVKEMLVYHLGKPLAKCTISIGVAVYPEDEISTERLLKAADNALYRAKHEGRDRVVTAE